MPSLPIAPDESGDVPRCVRECPHYSSDDYGEECSAPGHPVVTEAGRFCLPRVRELVAISRRRCDGCKWWRETPAHDDGHGHCAAHDQTRHASDCCRERWEANP